MSRYWPVLTMLFASGCASSRWETDDPGCKARFSEAYGPSHHSHNSRACCGPRTSDVE
ncbi:MAG: hypothetical protein GXX96_16510 [Planctomycetaceae bacterium]|nr:hypothetical protein [Planctomycetaceae bacterium]